MGEVNSSRFITNAGLQDSDLSKLQDLLTQLIGDPRLSNFLGNALQKAIGPMMSSNINMYGGATMPYGSSALFGPRNAGMEFMNWSQNQGIAATMNQTAKVVSDMRQQQAQDYLIAFGGAQTQAQAEEMARRFTFTGMASNFMFNQMQPAALTRGVEEASRYLGAGALGYGARTVDRQAMASRMGASVTADALQNPGQYYGLKGADIGRLYAEMGRTGQLGRMMRDNEGVAGPGGLEADVIQATREASRSIQAFRNIFRGSVTDVLDQVNALMGTDVMNTFDDQGRSLMQNMASAGSLVGFAPQQMSALGGMSRRISMQAGLDPWGSAASATYTAQLIGAQRQAGIAMPFVNAVAFRNDVLRRTTGAQQSGLSRDISGAYALLAQTDKGSADKFLSTIRNMTPEETMGLDPNTIAQMVNGMMPDGSSRLNGFEIRDASYTVAAERARAQGIGTRVAARHNAASIQSTRMAMLQNQLRGSGADMGKVMASLGGGPITEARIQAALIAGGMDSNKARTTTGALVRRYDLQADALGFQGGARGVDQFLATTYETGILSDILDDTETGVNMLKLLGGRNVSGGLMGLNEYIREISGKGDATISGFVNAALGKRDGISAKEALNAFGVSTSKLQGFLTGTPGSDKARGRQQMAQIGANAAMKTLFTRQYKGRAATKAELDRARDLLGNFSGDASGLIGYATETSGGDFELETVQNILEIESFAKGAGKDFDDETLEKSATAMTVMEQILAGDVEFLSKGLRDKDKAAKFKGTSRALLDAYSSNVKDKGKKPMGFEEFKKSWDGWQADSRMDRKTYEQLLQEESRANEAIGAPGSTATGIGMVIELLKKIVDWVDDGGLNKATPDASSGRPG